MTRCGRRNIAGGFVYAEHRASQPARGDHLAPRRRQRQQRERKAAGEALYRLSSLSLLAAQGRQIDFRHPVVNATVTLACGAANIGCSVEHMTITIAARAPTFALRAFVLALGSACEAAGAEGLGPTVELKPGQEIAFSVAIADGHVTPGKARLLRSDAASVGDGEIRVSVVKHDSSPYADLTASEKTSAPVDFVATGLHRQHQDRRSEALRAARRADFGAHLFGLVAHFAQPVFGRTRRRGVPMTRVVPHTTARFAGDADRGSRERARISTFLAIRRPLEPSAVKTHQLGWFQREVAAKCARADFSTSKS
jgi:hypothetical protein